MSRMEAREKVQHTEEEEGIHQVCEEMIEAIKNSPSMFAEPRMGYLRDFISLVVRNPGTYPITARDDTISMPYAFVGDEE